ncbi:hypothetical protein SPRG_19688 [Saprolegnia parasitica CBS 223.65]|uniref:Uncharacterized protein n=1 Tax=Saprolegnia parasitica (strain CBS 223.65) TaxID=695850 RepID=A0A067CKN2_SAPPC|nr:hypothetical protein SPRG_19688 [Saprolegnia parasitica CBS 223.65]KDO29740.1 hypothetical protein SPRG_19688 [Saprolegnia parasitica CBS 223.65]|eukprot:XP_012199515.1 hypothetical protein SPRG_19688 [Saprolegnia parasitica CBS 223.65]
MTAPTIAAPLGLKLSYFRRFIELHGGEASFEGLTTAQVCFKYVVPFTETSGQSLVEHVRLHTADADYVQPSNWYISHAWLYTFTETLSSLELFFAAKRIHDPVVWFCVFNNNQHEAKDYPFSWWQSTFKDSLAAIGNVVMIMHPWKNPITLTRAWCVFEVYVAISVGASFDVALAPAQADSFFLDMTNDKIDALYEMLGSINSENARATVGTDKTNIDAVIAAEIGFAALDRMVFDVLDNWMQSALRERIHKSQGSLDAAKYNAALAGLLCYQCHFDQAVAPCEAALQLNDDAMCFRMQANTPTSSCEMELHKDSTAIVQVQVEATIAASFQWTLLQAGLQVLPVASESFLRVNAQGFCSIQHMLLLGSHRAFVDVLLCPDAA